MAVGPGWSGTLLESPIPFPVVVTIVANGDDDPRATFARGGPEQALPRELPPKLPPKLPWPPKVGHSVRVLLVAGGTSDGRLVAPIPDGPGGWIVLEANGQVRAIPLAQVATLVLQ